MHKSVLVHTFLVHMHAFVHVYNTVFALYTTCVGSTWWILSSLTTLCKEECGQICNVPCTLAYNVYIHVHVELRGCLGLVTLLHSYLEHCVTMATYCHRAHTLTMSCSLK